jgi:hypothetical protein
MFNGRVHLVVVRITNVPGLHSDEVLLEPRYLVYYQSIH